MMRPPQTPTEAMEFLARSWSVSSAELSRALSNTLQLSSPKDVDGAAAPPPPADDGAGDRPAGPEVPAVRRPPAHDDNSPSEHVKPKLLLPPPPPPPPPHSWTVGGWLKDHKEKRKEEARARNAQIHAATAVAGVAAAVAAVAAATAFSSPVGTVAVDARSASPAKTSAAIASAAALVASHCVEMAHAMGADRAQILTVVGSAVSIRTTGDIMALTAGAATALRGAAALRARLQKGTVSERKEPLDFVSKGGELLKRTRKGVLHWKKVSVNVDGNAQVVIKMTSVHIGGTFVKKKKSVVIGVDPEISPWPGRHLEEGSNQRSYFGIKATGRLIEFECRSKKEKQLWVEGIQQMLHSHGRTSTDHCVN